MGAEDELKHAVAFVRPVSVAFQVVGGFRFYENGVYDSDICGSGATDVNHAVLAVGYGVENGVPYWLLKNSWGEIWGQNGYFQDGDGQEHVWYCNLCIIPNCCLTHIPGERDSKASIMFKDSNDGAIIKKTNIQNPLEMETEI